MIEYNSVASNDNYVYPLTIKKGKSNLSRIPNLCTNLIKYKVAKLLLVYELQSWMYNKIW